MPSPAPTINAALAMPSLPITTVIGRIKQVKRAPGEGDGLGPIGAAADAAHPHVNHAVARLPRVTSLSPPPAR